MIIFPEHAERELASRFERQGVVNHDSAAWSCLWLESCGYPGLKLAQEALQDKQRVLALVADPVGVDLKRVSCFFLAPAIAEFCAAHGRLFLRNVRHGLYLVPFAVEANVGIGCPIDPAFAYGGQREKNPYAEKLATAARTGITVDEALWQGLEATA